MLPAEGDSPTLSHFRSVLKDQIHFVLIEYPGWREMIDAGAGFEALVDAAVAQICGQSRENEFCLLAGYSFGGLVAVETARRLTESGRQVGFLGLIDTAPSNRPTPSPPTRWHRLISALIWMSAFRTLKMIGQSARFLPPKSAFTLEFILNERLRAMSIRRLRLEPTPAPITLYRSNDGTSPDKGWSALGSRLRWYPSAAATSRCWDHPFLIFCASEFSKPWKTPSEVMAWE